MDACDEGLGAVLCQENDEQKLRLVAFYSRKLKANERKYAIGEKELMAIVSQWNTTRCTCTGKSS